MKHLYGSRVTTHSAGAGVCGRGGLRAAWRARCVGRRSAPNGLLVLQGGHAGVTLGAPLLCRAGGHAGMGS